MNAGLTTLIWLGVIWCVAGILGGAYAFYRAWKDWR